MPPGPDPPHTRAEEPSDAMNAPESGQRNGKSKAAPLPPAFLEAELSSLRKQLAAAADEKHRLRTEVASQRAAAAAAAHDAGRHRDAVSSHAMLRRVAEQRAEDAEAARAAYAWLAATAAVAAGVSVSVATVLARRGAAS